MGIFAIGGLCGACAAGWMNDNLGARNALISVYLLFIGGGAMMTMVENAATLVVARWIVGVASGVATVAAPTY